MSYLWFQVFFKKLYKLKVVALLLFLTGISGCKLFTGELKSREFEGRFSINSMNSAQQAYFLENDKFITELDTQSEIKNYDLKIVPQSDNTTKGIMHIAQAKREDIKSYLGLVYAIKLDDSDSRITITKVCEGETNISLTSIPELPNLHKDTKKSEDIKCPYGFKPLD